MLSDSRERGSMKKPTFKRIGVGLVQHLLAAGFMIAVASLLLNSYIAVESIDGTRVYRISSVEPEQTFEDSDIYNDLFRNAVSDITQLVVIKGQLETDDVFDPEKRIDITAYARRIGVDDGSMVTAEYGLDDLIKWGKHGIDYNTRTMSMSDFVGYFGYCLHPDNFKLDEYDQLTFDGFYKITVDDLSGSDGEDGTISGEDKEGLSEESVLDSYVSVKSDEELEMLRGMMKEYSESQLEDMVFSYLMSKDLDEVMLSREEDGSLTVVFPMLICRYDTLDGERQLVSCADNWVDYFRLQRNVVRSIETLTDNYERYQLCNEAYGEGKSNVKYMVRMMADDGILTYTNLPELKGWIDEEVTEHFSEYRRHLIYYPDSLVLMGNTPLSEDELFSYINLYEYAYPDTTHIWLGVDTSYSVEGDAFYNAYRIYDEVIPGVNKTLALIVLLSLSWLGICLYMSVTAGAAYDKEGEKIWYLNHFDHLWTEFLILFGVTTAYGGVWGYRLIMEVAATAGVIPAEMMGIQLTKLYNYGVFGIYGIYVSLGFSLIWYSLIRRLKSGNLWRDSLLHWFWRKLNDSVQFVFRHRNSVVSTMLPYNIFLFINLFGLVGAYRLWEQRFWLAIVVIVLIALDGAVGVFLFRQNAEQNEIVDGINRIREGEVEFKLDTENLHGASKELADAVNNIGDGIYKAVRTSMKDEQMKTDLITNVSHDIKTPLTSIINYVDLLKRLKIEEEPAKSYIEILDSKAQRLRQLTDDLVEASKISSGSIELEREKLNLSELINQSLGEFSEKLEKENLQVIFADAGVPAFIYADSRRMWRVVENLFNNICKYALEGTRVYIDMELEEGKIRVSFKNISRQQMNISPDELTERFIRGDSSRSTEGSGLGLSIAKNLVQVQGGSFEVFLDGDLFKIVIEFPQYQESE